MEYNGATGAWPRMKALLINPPAPQTFWSFDNVMKLTGKRALIPPLGLLTVAAFLPETWEIKLVDQTFQTVSQEDWVQCDLVLVSGMIVQQKGILSTIKEAKVRGKTVIVGGPWAFHFPDKAVAAGADVVVVGEAEPVMPEVLDAVRNGNSGKIIHCRVHAAMDKSPTPRYDLLNINAYLDMAVQFSRGCPFQCEFCDITLMLGRKVRTKTPEQIMKELRLLYDLGWRRSVFFVDDNFIGNPLRTRRLLRELIPWSESHGDPFEYYTQASVNLAAERELMDAMVKVGFFQVFLGIETQDAGSLKSAGKLQNAAVDLDQVCRKINEAGLQIIAGCILGFDNEKPGAGKRLIDFAVRNQIPEMYVTLLQATPGTELWHRLQREQRLID